MYIWYFQVKVLLSYSEQAVQGSIFVEGVSFVGDELVPPMMLLYYNAGVHLWDPWMLKDVREGVVARFWNCNFQKMRLSAQVRWDNTIDVRNCNMDTTPFQIYGKCKSSWGRKVI